MHKHICVLVCFNNFDHIIKSYESLYDENIDFFIVENYSDNSEKIKNFFKEKNLVGYIQFEKNISHNAVSTFVNDYVSLLEQYDYITISDCDLTVENSKEMFQEIIKNLDFKDVVVSCSDLTMINLPNVLGSKSWVPPPIVITKDYIEGASGVHLMTIKRENLWVIKDKTFLDSNLRNSAQKTKKNGLKHSRIRHII